MRDGTGQAPVTRDRKSRSEQPGSRERPVSKLRSVSTGRSLSVSEQTRGQQQTAAARDGHMRLAAIRCAQDPPMLAKAARTVRAGIELGLLSRADLDGPIVPETGP